MIVNINDDYITIKKDGIYYGVLISDGNQQIDPILYSLKTLLIHINEETK